MTTRPPTTGFMPISKTHIEALIPHAGAMCLLDAVTEWDEDAIVCVTNTHRDPANPLRRQGRLSAIHAFEYGAQAAAVHGGLCARTTGQTAPPGYLAALRDAHWFVAELDLIPAPLHVTAHQLLNESGRCIYAIRVSAGVQTLAEARIIIIPQPVRSPLPPPGEGSGVRAG
ncbi:MAG: hypothetical protein ACOYMW_11500 [Candidatus Competibacteraceae bacterium]